jgi:hypothetical protein
VVVAAKHPLEEGVGGESKAQQQGRQAIHGNYKKTIRYKLYPISNKCFIFYRYDGALMFVLTGVRKWHCPT